MAFSLLSSQSGKVRFDSFYEMVLNPPTILKGGTILEFIMVDFSVLLLRSEPRRPVFRPPEESNFLESYSKHLQPQLKANVPNKNVFLFNFL